MIGVDLLVAFVIALILGLLMIPLIGAGRFGWLEFLLSFILIFLVAWVGALWFRPVGPDLYGTPWLVMLGLAGIFALFLALLADRYEQPGAHYVSARTIPHLEDTLPPGATTLAADSPEDAVASAAFISFGILFWLVVIVLAGLIVGNYALVAR